MGKNNFLKWWQTIKVSWSNYTTYRLNFFLQVIGPSLVFFFIKYNLWNSIYNGSTTLEIKGYSFDNMIHYHVWSMVVGLLAQGHTAMNLSEDIRLGRISSYLIYPFNFWEFHTAGFLSFQVLQIIISIVTIGILGATGILHIPAFSILATGFIYTLFVSIFWYSLQYLTGLMAFWLEETWIIRVILQIVVAFLSGAIIPLDLYPKWLVEILHYTPFPYLTYYPIKLFMGEGPPLVFAYSIISVWIFIFIGVNTLLWRRGIKLYTAAGM